MLLSCLLRMGTHADEELDDDDDGVDVVELFWVVVVVVCSESH